MIDERLPWRHWVGRFAFVGVLATVTDFVVLIALWGGAGWTLLGANAASVATAAAVSWVLNRTITFRSDPYVRWVHEPLWFLSTVVFAGAVDVLVLAAGAVVFAPSSDLGVIAIKVPAVAAAALIRMTLYRWVLWRSVKATQVVRADRGPAPGEVRLSVVIPAYEEEGRIGPTVRRVRAELAEIDADGGLEIVVVDDGSTDRTAEEAADAGADRVVRQANGGKGAAVRAGMVVASGRTVGFTDADLAYAPAQLARLLADVEDGWDVVVGSRRHTDTTTLVAARRLREVGGRAINLLTFAVLLGQYRDTQCGLKAMRSDIARLLFAHTQVDGFAFDIELFHLVERYQLSLLEVPVAVENSTRSTVHVVRDAVRLVRDLFRIRWWSKQGAYRVSDDEWRALARR